MERRLDPLRSSPGTGHNGGPVVGERPSSTLPKMRYVCPLGGSEQDALGHADVRQGVKAEIQVQEEYKVQAKRKVDFKAYGRTLDMVTSFKYIGRVLTASDDNWTAVVANIWRHR